MDTDRKIIDFHTHIFPRNIREDRSAYFSGEPAFELLYGSPKSKMAGTVEILSVMEADSVDISVVFGFPWKNPETIRHHNDYILSAQSRFPGRLVGFCCVDANHPEAAREVERCLDAGMAGVGELAFYESGIDPDSLDRLEPVMAICRERDVPVMIHTNEPVGHMYPGKTPNTLSQIYSLPKQYPENTIVLAHWGGGLFFYHLLKKEADSVLKNVYYDTAASPFLYKPAVYAQSCALAGKEKILFGSDFPLIKPGRYFKEMLASSDMLTDEWSAVCGGNAARLLKL